MADQWTRFQESLYRSEELGLELDVSRMGFPEGYLDAMRQPMAAAFQAMKVLEKGSLANPDEEWQVGHYWLRAPELAPTPEQRQAIESALAAVKEFAGAVHRGEVSPPGGGRYRNLLLIGIGGSALGPQFLTDALGGAGMRMRPFFLDNTDPDGFARVFEEIGEGLRETLAVVTSKSGGTKETRNGMLAARAAYERAGLEFAPHAVAITKEGSQLHGASAEWLRQFPMWDWVGGRTSVFSPVGLLPAALLGFPVDELLRGAREMDQATRQADTRANPAALLALAWHHAGNGRGDRDMVVLPYRDRLQLFSRYLQQLVMESLGKRLDLRGQEVHQGVAVYGNKGSTDQHAYIQQLRDGPDNFFAVFIEVLDDGAGEPLEVDPGVTCGDYLHGFLMGTRQALAEAGRASLTISLDRLDAAAVGQLIALFDRAVGLYAGLIGINAYHQPGVEAGKKAAERVIALQGKVMEALRSAGRPLTALEAAEAAGEPGEAETVYHLLRHLAANPGRGVTRDAGGAPAEDRFRAA